MADFSPRNDFIQFPGVGVPDVHVFNEPEWDVVLKTDTGERKDLVFIDAFPHNGVYLHGQTGTLRLFDAGKNGLWVHLLCICHGLKGLGFNSIKADSDPVQSCLP